MLFLFVYGAVGLVEIRGAQTADYEVQVEAEQWAWHFEYADKGVDAAELHIPVDRRVHLIIKSDDVIHSFWVPAFGVKQDAVPGRPTQIYLTATQTGTFPGMCAELCGLGHTGHDHDRRGLRPGRAGCLVEPAAGGPPLRIAVMTAARRRPALLGPGLPRAILGALLGFAVGGGLVAFVLGGEEGHVLAAAYLLGLSASCSGSGPSASGSRGPPGARSTPRTNTPPTDAPATGVATSGSRPTTR